MHIIIIIIVAILLLFAVPALIPILIFAILGIAIWANWSSFGGKIKFKVKIFNTVMISIIAVMVIIILVVGSDIDNNKHDLTPTHEFMLQNKK